MDIVVQTLQLVLLVLASIIYVYVTLDILGTQLQIIVLHAQLDGLVLLIDVTY